MPSRTAARCARARRAAIGSAFLVALLCHPGAPGEAQAARAVAVRFSVQRGFFETPFDLRITAADAATTLRFTLDGSDPRTSQTASSAGSSVAIRLEPDSTYDGKRPRPTPGVTVRACAITPGSDPSRVETHTYLFLPRVIDQANIVPEGAGVFWDTTMDRRITRDPRYRDQMREALLEIPTLSIALAWEDLFGARGLHRGPNLEDRGLERAASVELIYPRQTRFAAFAGFQIDAGLKIQGGGSRWRQGARDPKQSFAIKFKKAHGPGKLKYPFFEAAPLNAATATDRYDRIVLRAGHNRSWSGPGPNSRKLVTFTRDEFVRAGQIAMVGPGGGSHGTFVHLYLNGLYWGLYNPCERPDDKFQAHYFGGEPKQYRFRKAKGGPRGDSARWDRAAAHLGPEQPYATVKQWIDAPLVIAYYITMWAGGGIADRQWYAGLREQPPGPLRWWVWDAEDTYEPPPGRRNGGQGYRYFERDAHFATLRKHPEFRVELGDLLQRHVLLDDGAFTDAAARGRWKALNAFIESAVIAESARWGGKREREPLNRDDHWYRAVEAVDGLLQGNGARMIEDLRKRGLFPRTPAPRLLDARGQTIGVSRLSVPGPIRLRIERAGAEGAIHYTTNGSDPRAEGGAPRVNDGGAAQAITVSPPALVKARTRNGTEWSPLRSLHLVDASGRPAPPAALAGIPRNAPPAPPAPPPREALRAATADTPATARAAASPAPRDGAFTAFNDLAFGGRQDRHPHVTAITTNAGNARNANHGELLDFATGRPTGVTLTVTGGNMDDRVHLRQGRLSAPGTDAHATFAGKVDCTGVVSYAGADLVLTFRGLDPAATYEIALFGNRAEPAYVKRSSRVSLDGSRAFVNASSADVQAQGALTTIVTGDNTGTGHVARYTRVVPGADGSVRLRVHAGPGEAGRYYANAVALRRLP
jgi:hypothetical protein